MRRPLCRQVVGLRGRAARGQLLLLHGGERTGCTEQTEETQSVTRKTNLWRMIRRLPLLTHFPLIHPRHPHLCWGHLPVVQPVSRAVQLHRGALRREVITVYHRSCMPTRLRRSFSICVALYLSDGASRLGGGNERRWVWHRERPHCCHPTTILRQVRERRVARLLERCEAAEMMFLEVFHTR